jgi:hypothetical protein
MFFKPVSTAFCMSAIAKDYLKGVKPGSAQKHLCTLHSIPEMRKEACDT